MHMGTFSLCKLISRNEARRQILKIKPKFTEIIITILEQIGTLKTSLAATVRK